MKLHVILFFALLMIFASCQSEKQYDRHQMNLQLTEDASYPLDVAVSDVQATVHNGKYSDWTGFKISAEVALSGARSDNSGWTLHPTFTSVSIDSLYEFSIQNYTMEGLANEIQDKLSNEGASEIKTSFIGDAFNYSFEKLMEQFINAIDEEDKLFKYYANQSVYINGLIKSLYTFPGRFTKGYQWVDNFVVEIPNYKEIVHKEDVSVEWELLRYNENEATFFGKGRLSYPKFPFDDSDSIRLDIKRQFGINLVIDRSSNWIKRGTIDLREETGEVVFSPEINADKRVPKKVRNIKIKLNPTKN